MVTESTPVVSILTSSDTGSSWRACLAAGFFPKQGELSLNSDNAEETQNYNFINAVLSKTDKTYYYAAFSQKEIKTCKMKDIVQKYEGKPTAPPLKCDTNNITIANQTTLNEIKLSGDPKGNTMLLVVTGLRLLLAKAVGLNIMVTIKAILF